MLTVSNPDLMLASSSSYLMCSSDLGVYNDNAAEEKAEIKEAST